MLQSTAAMCTTPRALRDSLQLKRIAICALSGKISNMQMAVTKLIDEQWRTRFGYDALEGTRYSTKRKRKSAPSIVDRKRMVELTELNVMNTLQNIVTLMQIEATEIWPPNLAQVQQFVKDMLEGERALKEAMGAVSMGEIVWPLLKKVVIVHGTMSTTLDEVAGALMMVNPHYNIRLLELSGIQPLLKGLLYLTAMTRDEPGWMSFFLGTREERGSTDMFRRIFFAMDDDDPIDGL